jgi:GTP-binding protein LepA
VLDSMELERERGITIKARAVAMRYDAADGNSYLFNLIDTPGHVDFNYEVLKSLQACEGAMLLVDSSQGVEAQTVVNALLAEQAGLTIVPVLNKLDLPHARPEEVATEIEDAICIPAEDAVAVSAKTGLNCEKLLEKIVELVPPPTGDPAGKLQALIFDAEYNDYRGVIIYLRIKSGTLRKGERVYMHGTKTSYEVLEIGRMTPGFLPEPLLHAGEVGYLICNIKKLQDVKVGDTLTHHEEKLRGQPLPGFRDPKPMVFCGFYPTNPGDFDELRKALEKLQLNDASFTFEAETSARWASASVAASSACCTWRSSRSGSSASSRTRPDATAPTSSTAWSRATARPSRSTPRPRCPTSVGDRGDPRADRRDLIVVPTESIGAVMNLCTERRGVYKQKMDYRLPSA